VPPSSIFSKSCMYESEPGAGCPVPEDHPDHVGKYLLTTQRNKDQSTFPTSSTRTPTHSPPRSPSPPSVKAPKKHPYYTSRHATFNDPRMAPNVAVLSNRPALPLAPSWTASSPPSASAPLPSMPNVGVKVPAGERGTGILVLRATPDVYPPPSAPSGMAGMMSGMTRHNGVPGGHIGVATEVYPRDPDLAFLWGSGASPRVETEAGEDVDMEQKDQWYSAGFEGRAQ
jgi:hypothetical protein